MSCKYYGFTKDEFIDAVLNDGVDNSTLIGFINDFQADIERLQAEVELLQNNISGVEAHQTETAEAFIHGAGRFDDLVDALGDLVDALGEVKS